jgi:hypothetical protein
MTIYTDTVYLPKYGVEMTITRRRGERWWVVGDVDMEGNARQRARKRRPRGSVGVAAYARSAVDHY